MLQKFDLKGVKSMYEHKMDIKSVTVQMKADSYKMAALSLETRNTILKTGIRSLR